MKQNKDRELVISNNCANADEGHEWCWDLVCDCPCHDTKWDGKASE